MHNSAIKLIIIIRNIHKMFNFQFKLYKSTRSYTADAVWYRQPLGKPTNTVMLDLN